MIRETITVERNTRETQIRISLALDEPGESSISTGLPFFDHMLTAFAHHGRFGLTIVAKGDLEVDPHHLVEDCGIVLGDAFVKALGPERQVARYGYGIVPMDEALSEAVVDLCNRPYLVYALHLPQPMIGTLDVALFREFFLGFSNHLAANIHLLSRHGLNSHHSIEAAFKALGRALQQATRPAGQIISTKGVI